MLGGCSGKGWVGSGRHVFAFVVVIAESASLVAAVITAVTTSCFALAQSEFISFWLVWLIPVAFIQYSLDSRVLTGHALRSSALGRANGIGYFVLVCSAVGSHLLGWAWLQSIIPMFSWALVASTVVSIADRLQATIRATRQR